DRVAYAQDWALSSSEPATDSSSDPALLGRRSRDAWKSPKRTCCVTEDRDRDVRSKGEEEGQSADSRVPLSTSRVPFFACIALDRPAGSKATNAISRPKERREIHRKGVGA